MLRLAAAACLLIALPALPVGASHLHSMPVDGTTVTVRFDHDGDNEWWVEVLTRGEGGDGAVTVDARAERSATWHSLRPFSSDGVWSKWTPREAFRIPPGERVQFRAFVVDGETGTGATVESCLFTHPAGVEQCTTTPGTFDASFSGVRGNEWWVQAQVSPNTGWNIGKVDARVDGGAWQPLAKQSWGTNHWAASIHVRDFQVVQLRATATTGLTDLSACHRWIPAPGTDAHVVACVPDPGPNVWQNRSVAIFFEPASDLAIGDGDRDTKNELYVTATEALYQIEPASSGGLRTTVSELAGWNGIAVGDGDNDGRQEIYATRHVGDSRNAVERLSWDGTAWVQRTIFASDHLLGAVALGDADNDGLREVYVASDVDGSATIVQLSWRSGAWQAATIAQFGPPDPGFLSPSHLWIGDADGDGERELAVAAVGRGYSEAWVVQKGAGWSATRVAGLGGSPPGGIVAGDADGDGRGEVMAVTGSGDVTRARWTGAAWEATVVANVGFGAGDMALGDVDNDGRPDMAFAAFDGHVRQLEWNGAWQVTQMGRAGEGTAQGIVVGDADNDGRREAFTASWNATHDFTRIYEFRFAPLPSHFDAQFSGVKGNEWWVQANVAANEPLAGVDARVGCTGEWRPLAKQSWGGWAASFRVPSGSIVDFRARSTSGATDVSGGYVWPAATPTGGC